MGSIELTLVCIAEIVLMMLTGCVGAAVIDFWRVSDKEWAPIIVYTTILVMLVFCCVILATKLF